MQFQPVRVEPHAIDEHLLDVGHVGPELAHLSHIYARSPRALVWHDPSPEWRLFTVLLPLGSRLSLIGNPIFAQLARAWGLNIRFVGIDRDGLIYDFKALLSDRIIRSLINALHEVINPIPKRQDLESLGDDALDVLFAALAEELLTVLARRRLDWGRHLLSEHRLEPGVARSLFDRDTRYPDFLGRLRSALREEIIDQAFYGRVLRSIDQREAAVERQLATMLEMRLDALTCNRLSQTAAGRHLGCYNWLMLDERHAPARAYAVARLPLFSSFFAESLLTLETGLGLEASSASQRRSAPDDPAELDRSSLEEPTREIPTLALQSIAARSHTAHGRHWGSVLRRAIDAGQDRGIIEALAQRFAVTDNVIRRLWREPPKGIDAPPTWHLTQILRKLNTLSERHWPRDESQWQSLACSATPEETN
jgi:hypothetical protein